MAKHRVGTTKTFLSLLKDHPSRRAAAGAWGVDAVCVKRVMQGKGITLGTAFQISRKTGRTVEELFTFQAAS